MTDPKQNSLVIRDARTDELDEVSVVIREAYKEYEKPVPRPSWKVYIDDIADVRSRLGTSQLIVAELQKRIAGTVTLYLRGNPEEGWPEDWAVIRILAVHPDYRGQDIGHKLMDECIHRCRLQGISTIGLHTTRAMSIAQGMYERMGFKRVPEFDHQPVPEVLVLAYRLDI